jgi:adenylate kinase family enzyme
MFKDKLLGWQCQNQGFVLDGFPKTEKQAEELFSGNYPAFTLFVNIILSVFQMLWSLEEKKGKGK